MMSEVFKCSSGDQCKLVADAYTKGKVDERTRIIDLIKAMSEKGAQAGINSKYTEVCELIVEQLEI